MRTWRMAIFLGTAVLLLAQGTYEVAIQREWSGYWAFFLGVVSLAFLFEELNRAFGWEPRREWRS